MKLADFQGTWAIERQIEDRLAARNGSLTGRAAYVPDKDGLVYTETGILRFPGQPDLSARQCFLWRQDGDAIAVLFSDGRPFHRITARSCAVHDCAPDLYRVTYDFVGWPDWQAIWKVSGPRKDYTSTTLYARN